MDTLVENRLWDALKIGPQWLLRDGDALAEAIEDDRQTEEEALAPASEPERAPAVAPRASSSSSGWQTPPRTAQRTVSAPPSELTQAAQRRQATTEPTRTVIPSVAAAEAVASAPSPRIIPITDAKRADILKASWEELQTLAEACRACVMGETRHKVVLSDGGYPQDFVIVGEAPGREEDLQGIPYVGKSGQLLTSMLESLGLRRPEDVTLINVVKCRPSETNRDPTPEEIAACSAYLIRQMQLLQPKVVLITGRFAMQALLGLDANARIGQERGKIHDVTWHGLTFKAVVTYHPSYLLRRPQEKRAAWSDLLLLKAAFEASGLAILGHFRAQA